MIKLDVWRFNEQARRFFARHGFATLHERMQAVFQMVGKEGMPTASEASSDRVGRAV